MPPRIYDPIDGDEVLWRRLTSPDWITLNPDGSQRISSAAFKDNTGDEGRVSVHIARETTEEKVFSIPPVCYGIAEIRASVPQSLGHRVQHTPTSEDYSHASIIPPDVYGSSRKKSDSKRMANSAQLIPPRP
jgi:hypothetical protein